MSASGVLMIALAGGLYPLIEMGTMVGLENDNVLKPGAALYAGLFEPSPPGNDFEILKKHVKRGKKMTVYINFAGKNRQ